MVGDTTMTMTWIGGAHPLQVIHAYAAAVPPLLLFFGVIAARRQHAHQPIGKDPALDVRIDWPRLSIVALILLSAGGANVWFNVRNPAVLNTFPAIASAVWMVILATAPWRRPDWHLVPEAAKESEPRRVSRRQVCLSPTPRHAGSPARRSSGLRPRRAGCGRSARAGDGC